MRICALSPHALSAHVLRHPPHSQAGQLEPLDPSGSEPGASKHSSVSRFFFSVPQLHCHPPPLGTYVKQQQQKMTLVCVRGTDDGFGVHPPAAVYCYYLVAHALQLFLHQRASPSVEGGPGRRR